MAEMVTEETTETVVKTEPQAQPATKTAAELQAELDRMSKSLKEANKQAAAERFRVIEFEKAEEARKLAELSEQERLKKEVETLRAQAAAAERAVLQRDIAAEVGLPTPFASRIVGADREAMLADAKALLEAMPKGKPTATGSATNPGAATTGETDAEKRKRLGLA